MTIYQLINNYKTIYYSLKVAIDYYVNNNNELLAVNYHSVCGYLDCLEDFGVISWKEKYHLQDEYQRLYAIAGQKKLES